MAQPTREKVPTWISDEPSRESVYDPYYFGSFAAMELIMIGDVCTLVGSSAWSADRADPGPCDTMIDVTEYLKTPGLPIDYLMDKIAMTC